MLFKFLSVSSLLDKSIFGYRLLSKQTMIQPKGRFTQ